MITTLIMFVFLIVELMNLWKKKRKKEKINTMRLYTKNISHFTQ